MPDAHEILKQLLRRVEALEKQLDRAEAERALLIDSYETLLGAAMDAAADPGARKGQWP